MYQEGQARQSSKTEDPAEDHETNRTEVVDQHPVEVKSSGFVEEQISLSHVESERHHEVPPESSSDGGAWVILKG